MIEMHWVIFVLALLVCGAIGWGVRGGYDRRTYLRGVLCDEWNLARAEQNTYEGRGLTLNGLPVRTLGGAADLAGGG